MPERTRLTGLHGCSVPAHGILQRPAQPLTISIAIRDRLCQGRTSLPASSYQMMRNMADRPNAVSARAGSLPALRCLQTDANAHGVYPFQEQARVLTGPERRLKGRTTVLRRRRWDEHFASFSPMALPRRSRNQPMSEGFGSPWTGQNSGTAVERSLAFTPCVCGIPRRASCSRLRWAFVWCCGSVLRAGSFRMLPGC